MLITVVDHNPNWRKEFQQESAKLKTILKDTVHHIHHIGSTAHEKKALVWYRKL